MPTLEVMRSPRLLAVLVLVLIGHLGWLIAHHEPAYAGPDAHGYYVQARRIATEGTASFVPESPLAYLPVHWNERPDGTFRSLYAPGLPLLLAIVYTALGPEAALLVDPALATLCVLLLYSIVAYRTDRRFGLAAAVLLATLPSLNRQAGSGYAHVAVCAALLGTVAALDRWSRKPAALRAVTAGLLIGALPTLRYPAALPALVLAAYAVVLVASRPDPRRHLAWMALGAALPIGLLATYHHAAFGAPWATGYEATGEGATALSVAALRAHAIPYLRQLWGHLQLVMPVGFAGLLLMTRFAPTRRLGYAALAMVVATTALYMAFFWGTRGDAVGRFLLPTMPWYVAGAVCGLHGVAVRARRPTALVGLGLLVVVHLAAALPASAERMAKVRRPRVVTAAVQRWARTHVPPGAVLVAPLGACEALDYLGRWKLVDEAALVGTRAPAIPVGLSPAHWEGDVFHPSQLPPHKGQRRRAQYESLPQDARAKRQWDELLRWADGQPVYWLGSAGRIATFTNLLGTGVDVTPLGRVPVPGRTDRTTRPRGFWKVATPVDAVRLDARPPAG